MGTLIENTTLITSDNGKILEKHSIGWNSDKIDYIGMSPDYSNYDEVINGNKLIVMPGLINTHFHSTSALLKGTAQDVPESEWMMKAMAPISKFLTKEDRILSSKLAVLEGIRTGTTTFSEYSSEVFGLYKEIYEPLGARIVAAETINEISSDKSRQAPGELYNLDYDLGNDAFTRTEELLEVSDDYNRFSVLLGPQALDMVTERRLNELQLLSKEQKIGIHMHVAQGERERRQIEKRYGKSTIHTLQEMNYLNERLVAAHCHNTTQKELELMATNGVKMVSCQSSIGIIDGVVPPLYQYSQMGGNVGIGTDQLPGVGHCNLFREMRTGAQFAKIINQDPTILPPWQMLRHATIEGAEVLGISDRTGNLKIGKQADIITISKDHLSLTPITSLPIRNILPSIVYSASGYEVNDVFISGKQILRNGEFSNPVFNIQQIMEQANSRSQEIIEKAETEWREVGSRMVDYHDNNFL